MTIYQAADQAVTSVNALISTIRIDNQVRRWFAYLISRQAVKRELSENKEIEAVYKKIRNVSYWQSVIYLFLSCAFLFVVITGQFKYSFVVVSFVLISIFLHMKKKERVVRACSFLIKKDFEKSSFARRTLYQIGEFYGRKYNIVSLVDFITSTDGATRKAVLYALIFATLIYPLNFWQTCSVVLAAYYIFYSISAHSFQKRTK